MNKLDDVSSDDIKVMLLTLVEADEIAALKDFIAATPLVPAGQWIKVSTRLPPQDVPVLITVRDARAVKLFTDVGSYEGDGFWRDCDGVATQVLSWMPMPKPDTEESK